MAKWWMLENFTDTNQHFKCEKSLWKDYHDYDCYSCVNNYYCSVIRPFPLPTRSIKSHTVCVCLVYSHFSCAYVCTRMRDFRFSNRPHNQQNVRYAVTIIPFLIFRKRSRWLLPSHLFQYLYENRINVISSLLITIRLRIRANSEWRLNDSIRSRSQFPS